MFEFLDSKKFNDAYDNKEATLFIKPGMPEITWQEVLQFTNDHQNKKVNKLRSPYAFFHNEAQIISKVNLFAKEVHSRFYPCFADDIVLTCQLFGSTILEGGQTFDKHEDRENNLFWQGRGKSRWRLYDTEENPKPFMDVIIEDGDVLYIPGGTYHIVEPITPRFAFATLFGDRK